MFLSALRSVYVKQVCRLIIEMEDSDKPRKSLALIRVDAVINAMIASLDLLLLGQILCTIVSNEDGMRMERHKHSLCFERHEAMRK